MRLFQLVYFILNSRYVVQGGNLLYAGLELLRIRNFLYFLAILFKLRGVKERVSLSKGLYLVLHVELTQCLSAAQHCYGISLESGDLYVHVCRDFAQVGSFLLYGLGMNSGGQGLVLLL